MPGTFLPKFVLYPGVGIAPAQQATTSMPCKRSSHHRLSARLMLNALLAAYTEIWGVPCRPESDDISTTAPRRFAHMAGANARTARIGPYMLTFTAWVISESGISKNGPIGV